MSPPSDTSVMLVTGEYFDHLAPDPSVITLTVFEHGLDVPRLNNQTIRPITVLEHSMRVRRIVAELGGDDDSQLWALLHDAHEALVPWGDCLRPGKTDAMRTIEMFVDAAIFEALGFKPTSESMDIVKAADSIALYFEAMLWQPGAIGWAPGVIYDLLPKLAEYLPHVIPTLAQAHLARATMRANVADRFMPLISPRPGENWRAEVVLAMGVTS